MAAARTFIGQQEAAYIHILLGSPEPKGKEAALERLCAHYRHGRRLRDPHAICQTLSGMLFNGDPNVRRWTFNAIALVGNKAQNLDATLDALERNRDNEDIFAAGMAAIVALTGKLEMEAQLKRIGVELEGAALLAAAQQAPFYNDKLVTQRVHPDASSASELRLAAVLVGLAKAPENLFSISHENSAVIGSLHSHEDKQVAQYAAWAVCENPQMNITHIGFPPSAMRDQIADVRKYGYRLLTTDEKTAERYRDLIEEGCYDSVAKAREGLAIGLSESYFEGFDSIALDWFSRETDPAAKDAILDHFVAQAHRSSLYDDFAKERYAAAPAGSVLRARLEARAEGKPIFGDFKRIAFRSASFDLFEGVPLGRIDMSKNITINGNVGVVADSSHLSGGIHQSISYEQQSQELLQKLITLLERQDVDGNFKVGRQLAIDAKSKPNKSLIKKVIDWMGNAKKVADFVVGSEEDFAKLAENLGDILEHLD